MTLYQKERLQRKRKLQGTLHKIDDGMVKIVVENLYNQNKPAYNFYCNNLKQRKISTANAYSNLHFVLMGYPLNKFSDEWDGNIGSEYFESFTFKSLMPKYITPIRNVDKSDPVTEYMKKKDAWVTDLITQKKMIYKFHLFNKYEKLKDGVTRCPKIFVDMAAKYDNDPDPYMTTPYNWYYTGNGNFHMISLNWVDYLLHSELNFLYLSEFSRDTIHIDINDKPIFDCGENVNILETIYSSQNIIVLRTMKKVFILKIVMIDTKAVAVEKVKVIESKLPYTSVNFDGYHTNILYVTTLDSKLSIINLDRVTARSVKLSVSSGSLTNNWNAIVGAERGYYTHVERNIITIFDKRSNSYINHWSKRLRYLTDDIRCNDISVAKQREGSSALYFCTDHHVFKMDMRYCHNSKPRAVQRWTHGMQCVPIYMELCDFEFSKELLCLSSQWCEDMCVVSNYTNGFMGSEISGVTIPYRPPNILNTLNEARKNLLCHDFYNKSYSRLSTAITGSVIYKQNENYIILMQNSLGDVTSHVLHPEHIIEYLEDDSYQKLDEWCKSYKVERKDFNVSKIVDISNIWKRLRRVPDDHNLLDSQRLKSQELEFNEAEIHETFDNEEIDSGLAHIWLNNTKDETTGEQSSQHLHFSDSE